MNTNEVMYSWKKKHLTDSLTHNLIYSWLEKEENRSSYISIVSKLISSRHANFVGVPQ